MKMVISLPYRHASMNVCIYLMLDATRNSITFVVEGKRPP